MRLGGLLVFVLALAFAPVSWAQQNTIAGEWQGVYGYEGRPEAVPFNATIGVDRGRVRGTTIERNTFGAPGAMFLPAIIAGERRGDHVRFSKTYDGTAGQSHTVLYEGDIAAGGRRIVGRWSLAGQSGPFEMAR